MDNRKMIYLDDALDAVEKESQMDGAYGYMDTKSIVDLLSDLPSAQPDLQQTCNKLATDCISRQDAIDAVAEGLKCTFVEYRDVAEKMLNKVPSAQPLDAQMAYYMGLHDGVKECNEKLERFIDEMRRQE